MIKLGLANTRLSAIALFSMVFGIQRHFSVAEPRCAGGTIMGGDE